MSASFLRARDRPAQQRGYLRLACSVAGAVRDGRGRDVVGQRQLGDLPARRPASGPRAAPASAGRGSGALFGGHCGVASALFSRHSVSCGSGRRAGSRPAGAPRRIECGRWGREPGARREPDARRNRTRAERSRRTQMTARPADEDDPRGQHDQVGSGHPRRPPTAGAVMISAPGGRAGLSEADMVMVWRRAAGSRVRIMGTSRRASGVTGREGERSDDGVDGAGGRGRAQAARPGPVLPGAGRVHRAVHRLGRGGDHHGPDLGAGPGDPRSRAAGRARRDGGARAQGDRADGQARRS